MPFKSEAQRKYLYANAPKVAEKFQKETPKGANLPSKLEVYSKNTGGKNGRQ